MKLHDNDLKVYPYIKKDSEETEEQKNENRAKTKHNKNIKNNEEFLEQCLNLDKENQMTEKGKRENEKDIALEEDDICSRCKEKLREVWKKPHWKWNMDKNIRLCFNCYKIKEIEYEKRINYCIICDTKLKFFRYNPRPEWKMNGQLCRKCWDSKNITYKNEN